MGFPLPQQTYANRLDYEKIVFALIPTPLRSWFVRLCGKFGRFVTLGLNVAQWHISDDNYVAARAAIINAHHRKRPERPIF